ncbi:hypothetical protein Vadar_020027 [Vaccinium darrowii]|uniref:Uncharacterized protein n=1 Tax=Vaccinium darrowii TaxID=229202 RepID=A0ACB7YP74_9ERIC|nr:hypothetical protein Vadar_020027 [Vaccinium darrowii]
MKDLGVQSGAAFRFPTKVCNRVIKPQALKANDLHKLWVAGYSSRLHFLLYNGAYGGLEVIFRTRVTFRCSSKARVICLACLLLVGEV